MTAREEKKNFNSKKIKILLAENRGLVREAWNFILKKDDRFQVIAECGSHESAILEAKNLNPDIVMMEIKPPELSGIELVSLVRKFCPATKILAVSLYTLSNIAREVMKAGASGYVTKTSAMKEMLRAVIRLNEGEDYLCKEILKNPSIEPEESHDGESILNQLSIREMEVFTGIRNGLDCFDIGEQLNIAELTVEMHRRQLLKKLQLAEDWELIEFSKKN